MFKYISLDILKSTNLPHTDAGNGTVTNALNIVFGIVGALAFLMVVIGGLRYILAQGDPNKISESKRTIVYALAGLLIVALASVIVNFVISKANP